MNREAIYQRLFDKVSTVPGFITTSRKLKHWNDVPPSEQPALFVAQGGQFADTKPSLPVKWKLSAEIYLYTHDGNDPNVIPATQLNNLLDEITKVFQRDDTGHCTLDGLVFHAYIDGKIETDEGLLGPQSVAIVPISMIVIDY